MTSHRDLAPARAAEELSGQDLPFAWYVLGPAGDGIEVEVSPRDCAAAESYFDARPVRLPDGTEVPVSVRPRRGASWVVQPEAVPVAPSPLDASSLVGRDVHDAAARASAMGWRVLAHESEAIVNAILDPRRIDLCFDDDMVVTAVGHG
jgi:hypothetical protein